MKRILALMFTLMLLCSAALADAPSYSPALAAQKLAIHAMCEKYGFSAETLGVFSVLTTQQDSAYTFRFQSAFLPASRVGEYTAIVKGEDVTLTWTHDGTNIDHSTGDPDCAVWGPSQIKAYLAVDSGERYLWTAPYFANDGDSFPEPETSVWLELELSKVPKKVSDLPVKEARAIADAALMDVYGLTAEAVAALDHSVNTETVASNDGRRFIDLTFSNPDMCFHILINADTRDVFHIVCGSGGNG